MRTIKFRVWDEQDPKMYNDASVMCYDGVMWASWGEGTCELELSDHDEQGVHLMQYTGLKDKSGVEIYEGDIVIDPMSVEDSLIAIIYEEDQFGGYMRDKYKSWIAASELEAAGEVIGNIHENPELLINAS